MTTAHPRHKTEELLHYGDTYLTRNYKQQPIVLTHGQGCEVWDADGRRYLDLTGGIAACPLGHAHPRLCDAIAAQARRLIHVSNLYYNEPQLLLARRLCESVADSMGPSRAFFCNSGAEANEAAIKLAKRYQHEVVGDKRRVAVLSFEGSFHGRTVATVALTGQEKYRAGFGPLIEWARYLPWPEDENDQRALDRITEEACAVIIEPIQAEGGIRVPPPGFLGALRQRCDETGVLLIFDEVQTGIGRTGTLWGHQGDHDPVAPDILSSAKGLGGGVPIGAIVAREAVARAFVPGSHASTFGGNPLATAAALAVLDALREEDLCNNAIERGAQLHAGLLRLCERHAPHAREVRGRGLLRGLALAGDAVPVVNACRERGLLLSVAGGNVVRFAPPLICGPAHIEEGLRTLDDSLSIVYGRGA
jgi:predicted acetylornithine/succinylornithine family transaminase